MPKLAINLLQSELVPKQPLWTLKRVVMLWFLAFAGMFTWTMINQVQLTQKNNELTHLMQQKQQNDEQLAQLEQQVAQNRADPVLQEELETLKLLLANKESLHEQLTDASSTYAVGFSQAMTELSELHHKDISLQHVNMNVDNMMFSGLARKPDAVPAWLAGFEDSTFLSGQAFRHFSLNENDDKVIEFSVSSNLTSVGKGGNE